MSRNRSHFASRSASITPKSNPTWFGTCGKPSDTRNSHPRLNDGATGFHDPSDAIVQARHCNRHLGQWLTLGCWSVSNCADTTINPGLFL